MTMRVLIVDDEPAARRGILQRLATESDIEIVGECSGGGAAIEAIRNCGRTWCSSISRCRNWAAST